MEYLAIYVLILIWSSLSTPWSILRLHLRLLPSRSFSRLRPSPSSSSSYIRCSALLLLLIIPSICRSSALIIIIHPVIVIIPSSSASSSASPSVAPVLQVDEEVNVVPLVELLTDVIGVQSLEVAEEEPLGVQPVPLLDLQPLEVNGKS